MKFRRALVREVPDSYRSCISSHPAHSSVRVDKAREQHAAYQSALRDLGLEVIVLEKRNEFPDSVFIEDTAVIHGEKAVITRLARESRQGEEISVEAVLREFKETKRVVAPGSIEGGDVIHLKDYLISGLTSRTNMEGVRQTQEWLNVPIKTIEAPDIVHLKSYVTSLGEDVFVATKEFMDHPLLEGRQVIEVPIEEQYGANTLFINGVVLMSQGHEVLQQRIVDAGFDVVTLNMSEFEKCEGALTCLSLRF